MSVLDTAREVYGLLPAEFTPARTAAEKEAKAAGDKDLAAQVKALRKPSVGAWAVNQLVRREADQIDQVLALAASLREAAANLDGAELRELTKQRRQLTAALTTRARQLALEQGIRLTESVADQVEATLTAAMLDEGVATAVRSGLLVATLTATGVDEVDATAAVAVPEAVGTRAPSVEARTGLHAVPDSDAVKRERAKDAVKAARKELDRAARAASNARKAVEQAEGERMRLASESDELTRRLAEIEEQLESADERIGEVQDAAEEADATEQGAQEALAVAEETLAGL